MKKQAMAVNEVDNMPKIQQGLQISGGVAF